MSPLLLAAALLVAPPDPSATPAAPLPTPAPSAPPLPTSPLAPAPAPQPAAAERDREGYSYDYALYDSRYGDVYTSVDAYKPFGPRGRLRPFVDVAAIRDTRSGAGDVPLILSDNYALGALGVQYANAGFRAFVQAGGTTHFGPVAAQASGGDLRGGVQWYRDLGTPLAAHRGYGNVYVSTTYYSRYSDWVLYAQHESIANVGSAEHALELFVRPVLTLDTLTHYYANLVEASVGVRYHAFGRSGPTISLEGAAGAYLRGAIRPAGTPLYYTDFRPTVSYGFSL